MSKVLQRGTAVLALMIASVAFITTAHGADAHFALEEGRTISGAR